MEQRRHVVLTLAGIIAAGLILLLLNDNLPIVRNGFVYAKAAMNIIAHGFNPLPVITDVQLSNGKPIAFSLLSAPLVATFGANTGVKLASFLGTAFFLSVVCLAFGRLNRRLGIDSVWIPLELLLLSVNPLVFYQFWSAYPDSLFAGEVLLAFVLVDLIVEEPERDTRALIVLLGLVIYSAILTKLYGAILGLACPVYILLHARSFRERATHLRSKIVLLCLVFMLLAAALVVAQLGKNPTLNFYAEAREGAGYAGYMSNLLNPSWEKIVGSAALFVLALGLNFHLSLAFLAKGRRAAWPLAPTTFAAIYVSGLLTFSGTSYNMRFLLPVFPFVVAAIALGIAKSGVRQRRWGLFAFATVAFVLTLNYNLGPLYRLLEPANETVLDSFLNEDRRLDNLRLGQHRDMATRIQWINEVVEPNGVLYWSSRYYGAATHGVVEHLGVRSDVEVRYIFDPWEIPTGYQMVYVTTYRTGGSIGSVRDRFTAEPLGGNLTRLFPARIELASPEGDHFDFGEPIVWEARASVPAETPVRRVEFLIDQELAVADSNPPYEFTWHDAPPGQHIASARLHFDERRTAVSTPVVVFVGVPALEKYVARSLDDAEELPDGFMYFGSSDLELVEDPRRGVQVVGLRFTNIRVPANAAIARAYLQFTSDEASDEPTSLAIHLALPGSAATFQRVAGDLTSRELTTASVAWSPEPWTEEGETSDHQRTPDLSSLLEELFAHPDWQEGGALVVLIRGSGRRVARSYDEGSDHAPRLYIELERS